MPGVELLFTPKEEVGLARRGRVRRVAARDARLGYVYDHAGPIGEVILGAPYQQQVDVRFHGRAAHAGMYPEEGRSAIAAAARAIADLRLGRLDDETSANVGEIQGGTARNVVPEHCWFAAEARSHDERKLADVIQEMVDTITFAAEPRGVRGRDADRRRLSRGYRFRRDDLAGAARRDGARARRAASRASSSPAAALTRTSSTSAASSASTSPTG